MSEEEIINKVEEIIEYSKLSTDIGFVDQTDKVNAIQGLLDLYNKEKEKNKELEDYILKYYDDMQKEFNGLINHKFIDYIPKSKVQELIEKYKCFKWKCKDDEYWANRIITGFVELLEERN